MGQIVVITLKEDVILGITVLKPLNFSFKTELDLGRFNEFIT